MQFILGKWISKPIYVAAALGIADMLAEGPKSIEALAKMSESHAPTLYRVMRALAGVGIFSETGDKCFELTPMAECLKTGIMRSIALMFHADWHDEQCQRILNNCHRAMKPGSKLFIVETLIPPGNEFSIGKLLDLEVFVMGGGRERTQAEFKGLLEAYGFRLSQIVPTEESISLIECIKI